MTLELNASDDRGIDIVKQVCVQENSSRDCCYVWILFSGNQGLRRHQDNFRVRKYWDSLSSLLQTVVYGIPIKLQNEQERFQAYNSWRGGQYDLCSPIRASQRSEHVALLTSISVASFSNSIVFWVLVYSDRELHRQHQILLDMQLCEQNHPRPPIEMHAISIQPALFATYQTTPSRDRCSRVVSVRF